MAHTIPLVDIEPFRLGTPDDRANVAAEIDAACVDVGFFTVVGHGVDPALIASTRSVGLAFFDLPLDERMAVAMPAAGYPYGYNPFSVEALNRSIGGTAPPDLKETFNVGPVDPPPRVVEEMDDPDERAVYSPNLWPPALPELRPAIERYYRTLAELSATLMNAFAVGLGRDDGGFDALIDRHGSALRLAHYPALDRPAGPGRYRAGAHTDYGTLTILDLDDEPGLQVESSTGDWIDVAAVPEAFVVNLGDLMQRWTRNRWRSTMHRVVVTDPTRRRLTIPFFHNANWDAEVDGIAAGKHLMDKFRSTMT